MNHGNCPERKKRRISPMWVLSIATMVVFEEMKYWHARESHENPKHLYW
jgi:paraquat-inducible protein B